MNYTPIVGLSLDSSYCLENCNLVKSLRNVQRVLLFIKFDERAGEV
jgi:hypothetical protein